MRFREGSVASASGGRSKDMRARVAAGVLALAALCGPLPAGAANGGQGSPGDARARAESLRAELTGLLRDLAAASLAADDAPQDLLPLVGHVRDTVWVAAGYSGHGNVLGFMSGELVASAILGRSDPLAAMFDPHRLI